MFWRASSCGCTGLSRLVLQRAAVVRKFACIVIVMVAAADMVTLTVPLLSALAVVPY